MKEKERRIYISGPITGTDDYTERFARAESELTMEGYSVVNPARVNAQLPADTAYEEYMKMCFTMLDLCGCIYMLDGWQKSCGANREYGYAIANDMVIMRQSGRNVDRQPAEWKDKIRSAESTASSSSSRHSESWHAMVDRITNAVSVYVLNQSMGYMDYLREESEV